MAISIFAKRAYLNTNPSEEFNYKSKPVQGYLKRVSSIIRADQIAKVLNARLNPTSDYQNDICIYVKPNPDSNGDFKFEGKKAYLDIIDEKGYAALLQKHPEVGAIVLSERDYINFSTLGLKNKIFLIPQHHCNFDREKRTRKKITVAGIIGNSRAFDFLPSDLKSKLEEKGLKFLEFSKFYRREDIIRSLGVLTFDDVEMNDLLDNLSQIDREVGTFNELLNASQNPSTNEGKFLQLKRRIEVLKSVAQQMQEQN